MSSYVEYLKAEGTKPLRKRSCSSKSALSAINASAAPFQRRFQYLAWAYYVGLFIMDARLSAAAADRRPTTQHLSNPPVPFRNRSVLELLAIVPEQVFVWR